jgi:hypothetical protein
VVIITNRKKSKQPNTRAQIDEIMKYLFSVSNETLINMLNSLFRQNFDVDKAAIIQTNSEFIDENFDVTRGDLFYRIIDKSKPHNLHIEIETRPNGNMTIRVLEYDIKKADENQRLDNKNNKSSIKRYVLPKSIVIHVEKGKSIPDCYEAEIVDIKPDGSEEIIHRLVPVIKYWELTTDDLIERKLYPLLPMQIFLLRGELKKFAKEKDSEAKRQVIQKIKDLAEKIIIEANNLVWENKINDGDDDKIVAALDKLIKYLNEQYNFDENLDQEVDTVMTSLYTTLKQKAQKEVKREIEKEAKNVKKEAKTEMANEVAEKMILKDKPLAEIIEFSGLTEKKIKEIANKLSKEIVL